jgi:hypothetical protein
LLRAARALGCIAVVSIAGGCKERSERVTLPEATLALSYGGRYDRVCPPDAPRPPRSGTGCMDLHFYVFPVVSAAWTKTSPVPAWVTCSANETSFEACHAWMRRYSGPLSGTVAVRVGDKSELGRAESGWERAIEDAVRTHGLIAAPRGPVLRLGAN